MSQTTTQISKDPQGFLLTNQRGWVSSNLFFYSLQQININPEKYYVLPGMIIKSQEMKDYTEELILDLFSVRRTANKEHYQYVSDICDILNRWANKGFEVQVIGGSL